MANQNTDDLNTRRPSFMGIMFGLGCVFFAAISILVFFWIFWELSALRSNQGVMKLQIDQNSRSDDGLRQEIRDNTDQIRQLKDKISKDKKP